MSAQTVVVAVGLKGIVDDIVRAEVGKDASLRLVPDLATEPGPIDRAVVVTSLSTALHTVIQGLLPDLGQLRVIAIPDDRLLDTVYRIDIRVVGFNVSPAELMAAIRDAARDWYPAAP